MQAVLLARDQRLDYTVSRTAWGCRAHRLHARGPGSVGQQAPSPNHTTCHRGSRHPQVAHGMSAGVQLRPGCAHCHNRCWRGYVGFNFAQPWSRHRAALEKIDGAVVSEFILSEGETAVFVLRHLSPELGCGISTSAEEAEDLFRRTVEFWQRWIGQSRYAGRWREMVNRSALALKL